MYNHLGGASATRGERKSRSNIHMRFNFPSGLEHTLVETTTFDM